METNAWDKHGNITASPLSWPATYKRSQFRQQSKFGAHTIYGATSAILAEVRRLGGHHIVVSTNLRIRADGNAVSGQRAPTDPGVAVYFTWRDKPIVFACDLWVKVEENAWAIAKHIEALRGQERWGVGSLEQAFAGYAALPAPRAEPSWWDALELQVRASASEIKAAYRDLSKRFHPDNLETGDAERFIVIQRAFEQARDKGLVD